jgi:hypothetical protein
VHRVDPIILVEAKFVHCIGFDARTLTLLTSELNPFAQRCLTIFFTGDFASWTVHFVNICVKNQQMHQLFIQFANYVRYLLHVSALHCHPQGAFLMPSERCSIGEQSIECCGWASPREWHHVTRHNTPIHNILPTALRMHEERSLRMVMQCRNM